jgi:hypothetical protein
MEVAVVKNYDAETWMLRRYLHQTDIRNIHEDQGRLLPSAPSDAPVCPPAGDPAANSCGGSRGAAAKPAPPVFVASPGGRRD